MATVYLAEDLKHHRKVAVKLLREDLAASVGAQRFLREIEIAAQLQHPNILGLLDSGNADGLLYYVMPYVEGHSLRQRLTREGELPVGEAVRILVEVVDALAYAHAHGVVHRDIKPDNVMLAGRHALVTDFGVARAVSEATGAQAMTTIGVALGTPAYMAPEQAMADPHVDHRADLYAVGVVAYELLTGRPPFTGITPQQVLAAHVTENPEPVGKRRPGVSPALEQIIMKCLAKRPADRWQSADDLLAQLEALATPSGGTQPTAARLEAVTVPAPRRRAVKGVLLVLGVIAVALFVRAVGPPFWFGSASTSGSLIFGNTTQVTNEDGLEIHPAISPDGKLVAYAAGSSQRMRIYIRPITGGRTIPLSDDTTALETQPRWSPDGNKILFLSNGGVYTAPALGGEARQIAAADPRSWRGPGTINGSVTTATWSPDGREVAIVRNDSLYVQSTANSARRFVSHPGFDLHSCSWSPTGKWLACVSGNGGYLLPGNSFGNIAPSTIVLVPIVGGASIPVTDSSFLYQSPTWSPDGKRVFFVSDRARTRDVFVANISAGGHHGAPERLTTGLNVQSIGFSADGRHLVYSVYSARSNIFRLPIPSGKAVTAAGAEPVTSGAQIIESMEPSRDGKWLLYDSDQAGNADIYRVPVAGGRTERLTTDSANDFAGDLSPDGREIAFHSWRTGSRDIYVQPLNGGPAQQVTSSPAQEESYPRWSPDGQALAFIDQVPPVVVYVVRRDGMGRWGTPVQRRVGAQRGPHWSPDGRWLAFTKDDGAIEVTPPDSGSARGVYAPVATSSDPQAADLQWSADGRRIFFKSHDAQGRAALWGVSATGGRPQLLVRFNDPLRPSNRRDFAADAKYFYFTMEDRQSDVWVADISKR
jgi:serine/threonine-protein kinase